MTTYDAGTARAVYEIDLSQLRTAEQQIEAFYARIRQRGAQGTPAAPALPAPPTGGGGGRDTTAAAERQALLLARARAQLARESGDLAGAERGLREALAGVTRESTTSIGAQRQLARVQRELVAGSVAAGGNLQALPRTIAGLSGEAASAASAVGKLATGFIAAGGAVAAFQAGQALYDFAAEGEGIAQAARSFDSLAASAGTSGEAILSSLRATAQGTVANTDLIQSSNTALLLLGNDVASQLPQLLGIAKASAATLGADVGDLFDNLVTGIARGSTELLDNLGISISATEAYETYAASIGKSADALTKAERSQAVLNAVLAQGSDIIARAGGSADQGAIAFQRADASLKNLTDAAKVAAAQGLAPLAGAFATAAQGGELLLLRLSGQSNTFTDTAAQIAATAQTYDEYVAAQQRSNAATDQVLASNGALIAGINAIVPGMGTLVAESLRASTQSDVLSEAQFRYAAALRARGVAEAEAAGQAAEQAGALGTITVALDAAAGSLDAYREQIFAVAAANEGNLQAVETLLARYTAQELSVEQLAAGLDGLAASTQAAELAALGHVAATVEEDRATRNAAVAAVEAAASMDLASLSAGAEAQALRDAAAAAYEQAAAGLDLEAQARAAAAALFDSGEAGAITAARLANSSSDVDVLTAAYYRLLAAQAAAAGGTGALGGLGDRVGGANSAAASTLAIRTRIASANRFGGRPVGARGSGGGGGGRGAASGPSAEEREQERQQERMAAAQDRYFEERAAAYERYREREIEIQKRYDEAQLEAQRDLQADSAGSRADFYEGLINSELPQDIQQSLSAAYEAAFAEAQRLSQEGKAALAADYLALKQEQLEAEQQYQEAVAEARANGDDETLRKLEAIKRLRDQEFAARESNLLAEGDQNVNQRDEALSDAERQRQDALGEAATKAGDAIVDAQGRAREAARLTADEFQRLLDLQRQTAGAPALPAAGDAPALGPAPDGASVLPPAEPLPAGAAPAPGGAAPAGAGVVVAPALEAQVSTLTAVVDRIAGVVEEHTGLLGQIVSEQRETTRAARVSSRGSG